MNIIEIFYTPNLVNNISLSLQYLLEALEVLQLEEEVVVEEQRLRSLYWNQ